MAPTWGVRGEKASLINGATGRDRETFHAKLAKQKEGREAKRGKVTFCFASFA